MNIISTAVYLIIGYLLGVAFTDHMFLDLSLTNWSSLMTYVWMLLWPFMLMLTFWVVAIVCIIIGSGFYYLKAR